MGVIDVEDIRGYWNEGSLYCTDCWEEPVELSQAEILFGENMEEGKRYFCDQCNCEITK